MRCVHAGADACAHGACPLAAHSLRLPVLIALAPLNNTANPVSPSQPQNTLFVPPDRAPQEAVVAAEGADDIVPEPVFAFTASRTIDAGVAAALPGADSAYGGGYGDYGYGAYGAYGGYGGYGGDGVVVEEEAPSNATLAEATPYTFGFRFVGMDFDALVADAPKLAAFKLGVRGSVANATGLTLASVFVANVTRGSVVRSSLFG